MPRLRPSTELAQARRAFFERGHVPAVPLPQTILRSWMRCRRLGLPDERPPAVEPVPDRTLRELRERAERLRRLARAELELLASDAEATGSIAILTDPAGWVLDASGHPRFLDKAGRVALRAGTCWNESEIGTNAIGTAIVEGRAVEVHGSEHYRAPHGILTCSAAPIHDPWGQLVGILDITGDARAQSGHALGLVRMAVANIEHRYFDEGIDGCELLRLHRDPALLGTAREGLLAFRNGKLVAANQAGLALVGLERTDIGRAGYEHLFDDALSRLRSEGALRDRCGRVLHGRVDGDGMRMAMSTPSTRAATIAPSQDTAKPRHDDTPLFDADTLTALERARRVLDADLPVLVLGETGTGKEVFARALHARCARAGKAFVAVNCAALPEGLIEAELFGYEEGAFTGARRQGSPGLLRQAQGGVLFLDEIGDMPLALQPRLLRVLQERELSPLGGGKPVKLDFALVCATHRDLQDAVEAGRFRADLYYRIAQHVVGLAPLRTHPGREALVRALWARLAGTRTLTPEACARLAAYHWPGNWRQLVACLRTLVALSDAHDIVDIDALPDNIRQTAQTSGHAFDGATDTVPAGPTGYAVGVAPLEALETAAMRDALAACGGNVARAAKLLGVHRSTLYRRLDLPRRPS